MVDRIIIHLGDSKCGSTSLQRTLRTPACQEVCFFPGVRLNHNGLAQSIFRPRHKGKAKDRFEAVWREIQVCDQPVAVVSAEQFQAVDPVELHAAITAYWPDALAKIEFALYLRPHVSKLRAMYSERVKFGAKVGSLEDYADQIIQTKKLDYMPRLAKWRALDRKVTIRAFVSDALHERDLVKDFFSVFLHRLPPPDSREFANRSLTSVQIELLKRLPELMCEIGFAERLPNEMPRLLAHELRSSGIGFAGTGVRFNQVSLEALRQRYAQDAAEVDRRFFEIGWFTHALKTEDANDEAISSHPSQSDIERFEEIARSHLLEFSVSPDQWVQQARSALRAARLGY